MLLFLLSTICLANNYPIKIRCPINNYLNKDLVICSFGASVTQQKNSIWDCFVEILNKKTGRLHKHIKMGYGGEHLYAQSICWIDDVIQAKPDICIVDWFDTSYISIDDITKKTLETLIRKLHEINSYIIFFYHLRKGNLEGREKFLNYVDNIALNYNVTSYDENQLLVMEKGFIIDDLLRDYTHTTTLGSMVLGEAFSNYFLQIPIDDRPIRKPLPPQNSLYNVKRKKISSINIIGDFFIDHEGFFVLNKKNTLCLDLNGQLIGLYMKIGPFSPIISILIDDQSSYTYSIWDPWCHYSRLANKDLGTPYTSRNIKINISDLSPNYSESRQVFDFSKIESFLKVKDFFIV